MYKDILTNLKIPALYILMNGKKEEFYDLVFKDILDIVTLRKKYSININTIVTNTEKGLINIIKNIFQHQNEYLFISLQTRLNSKLSFLWFI